MDKNVVRFLESLGGLGSTVNAADIINEIFPIPINVSRDDFNKEKDKVIDFLDRLRLNDFVKVDLYDAMLVGNYEGNPTKWFANRELKVSILFNGLQYLADEKIKKIELDVNQSVINTNMSIIATNTSVQATNTALVEISKNQAKILKKQTLIFFFTAVFAFGALIVSIVGLINDGSKEQLQKQLQDRSKEIKSLRNKLKIDSSLTSEAKKTSAKKN